MSKIADFPLNAEIARKLLEKKGCVIEWAQNGEEALNTFQSICQSCVCLYPDGHPHAGDGRTDSWTGDPESGQTRCGTVLIIAMTANAYAEDIQSTHDAGVNTHLSKPIVPDDLYQAIANMISR